MILVYIALTVFGVLIGGMCLCLAGRVIMAFLQVAWMLIGRKIERWAQGHGIPWDMEDL